MPDLCASRSRIVIVRRAGTGFASAPVPSITITPLNVGMNSRHRIGEEQLPFLEQHHDRDAGHGLGHRGDAEDRIGLHRRLLLDVLEADRVQIDGLPFARDERDDAADFLAIDESLHAPDAGARGDRSRRRHWQVRRVQRRAAGATACLLRRDRRLPARRQAN